MSLDYRILGPLEVWAGGRRLDIGGARQRRLIGALVLAGGRPLSAERLVDVVWVGDPPGRARNTLRTYIARARRVLEVDGDSPLLTDQSGWRLDRPSDALDSARFESLLASARAMAADPMAALTSIEEALSLWRDDALVEFRDEDWCAGEAVRLDELRVAAEEDRFDAMLGCGLYDDVIGELERFTGRHPLRDRPRAQQMVALYRAGRQVDAVRAFQAYRRFLRDEIGVEASDELRSLEQRIVARDPSLQQLTPDGRRLRGYQLGPPIGQGAFGKIYRAAQPALGREVAVKVVRPELADDAEFVRRFDGEARTIARLEHPHIVPLFDYWREPGGAYLVMRYLRGGSARQLVESQGALSTERVRRLLDQIGSALATAHAAGVVHRDVRPANILFDELGNAYLGDFGIALDAAIDAAPDTTASRSVIYASPEQMVGEATALSDIYALGLVLFELLTGQSPFPRDSRPADLVERKRVGALPTLDSARPDLPAELDGVIRRATAPEPADRFASVADLVVAFRSAVEPDGESPALPLGWASRNPYKGLAAFDEADALDFFGRDRLVDQLERALTRSRFVAAVGPSGSGKSSVVRAGLAPRLRREGAYVVAMVPGHDPVHELTNALLQVAPASRADEARAALRGSGEGLLRALAACLPEPDRELVLIVDQFEELFTLAEPSVRERFLRSIAVAVGDERSRIRVVVTIRADFYDRPLSDDRISELVQASSVAVTPLGPADLALAVTAPAERVGVTVEPALVAAVVADASSSAMALPLVQYELTSLFDGRDGETLTVAAYRRHGGLGGAIARRADEIYEGVDESRRDDVRRLFGRLVAPGDDRDAGTRRRVRMSELATIPSELVDAYVDARLLTVDRDPATREPTVEIAHEALIREWPRLRRWVDDDRDDLQTLRHLAGAADAWDAGGRDPGELYRGGRLVAAEEWTAAHSGELNPVEQSFVDASVQTRDAERAREQRRVRRLRALVAALAVVAVVAVAAGLVAVRQSRIADDNAAEAERRASENRTSQLLSESSLALVDGDPDLAILLALAANDRSRSIADTPQPGVIAALHDALQSSRLERIIAGGYSVIAVSPDGGTVALDHLPETNRLATYEIETGELLSERTLDSNVGGLAYSPDGSLLAVSFCCTESIRSDDLPAMLLLDPATLETVEELDGGVESWGPSWSDDGARVLSQGYTGVRVWGVGEPAVERTIADTDRFSAAAFVPGTSSIAIASAGTLAVVDADTGEPLVSHEVPIAVEALRVAPAGDRAAFIDGESEVVEVVDLDSGESIESIDVVSPEEIRFSPDGGWVAIAGNDDVVRVVSLDSSDVIELRGHGTGVARHAFSPDGRLLVPMRDGRGTRVWNLTREGPRALGNLTIGGQARGGQPRSDSSLLVSVETGVEEGHVVLLDGATDARRVVADFWFPGFAWPVYSPDGTLVAGYSPDDRSPRLIDVATGDEVATGLLRCDTPRAVDRANGWILADGWCPDEPESAAAADGRTGFIEYRTGDLLDGADSDAVFEAAIGPPGSPAEDVVAYTTRDQVVFRRASTRELLSAWRIPTDVIPLILDFSPDGSALGMSSQARQAIVFDVDAILAGADADDAVVVFPERHTGPVHRVVPVGDTFFTTGDFSRVRRWDAATGSLLVDVPTDLGDFVHLFALPDGEALFYGAADGLLRRYLIDADDMVELARSRVQRGFSEAECARYFPDGDCPT